LQTLEKVLFTPPMSLKNEVSLTFVQTSFETQAFYLLFCSCRHLFPCICQSTMCHC